MFSLKTVLILSVITLIISLGIEFYHSRSSISNKNGDNVGFSIKRWIWTMVPLYIFQFGSLYFSSSSSLLGNMVGGSENENVENKVSSNLENVIEKVQNVAENVEYVSGYTRKKKNRHHSRETPSIFGMNSVGRRSHSNEERREERREEKREERVEDKREDEMNVQEEQNISKNEEKVDEPISELSDNEEEGKNKKRDYNVKTDLPTF